MAGSKTMREQKYDPEIAVREAIERILSAALPPELRAAAPELPARVQEHPEVAPFADKRWCELTENQQNIIFRETGLVARDVVVGAGATAQTGEHLH